MVLVAVARFLDGKGLASVRNVSCGVALFVAKSLSWGKGGLAEDGKRTL